MEIPKTHSWEVDAADARRIQDEARRLVVRESTLKLNQIRLVVGIDNAYRLRNDPPMAYAAAVVQSFPALETVEIVYGSRPVAFPYIPGMLTFREAPAILDALRQVQAEPDVFLLDGQGIAHPRRIGLAAHIGVVLRMPTIGVAKSRLIGRYQEPADEVGSWTPLVDKGETIGAALRTKVGDVPLFISPGNFMDVETAVEIVMACHRNNSFLPEPNRLAHDLVTAYRKQQEPAKTP